MRLVKVTLIAALVLSLGGAAFAELQNVELNGSIRIRGNFYDMDSMGETAYYEQRTTLGAVADFTDEVSAVIEFDSFDNWGEDFRSDYVTGVDFRAASGNDVEVYQAYIQASEMWGTPLQLRVGRQEISLGSEWLVGVNNASSFFPGLSFDAIRLDYATDVVTVSAFTAKLAERFGDFGDNDIDLYGIYGSITALEDIVFDLYWLYVREDDVAAIAPFGGTDLDLHTLGLRSAGEIAGLDWEAELAFQFGDVEVPRVFFWRDADLDYSEMGLNLEVGYTFDIAIQPRIYLGYAFLGGDDGDDLSFNRLFSNWEYSEFLANTELSNCNILRMGGSIQATEAIEVAMGLAWFWADEERATTGRWFWADVADEDMGIEMFLSAAYQYSDDLSFNVGWAHFFGDDGLEDGNMINENGLAAWFGGDDDDDYDYLWIETEISF